MRSRWGDSRSTSGCLQHSDTITGLNSRHVTTRLHQSVTPSLVSTEWGFLWGFFFFLWLYDFKRRQSWKTCFPDACPWKYCLLLCKLCSRRPLHPFCCLASTDVSNIVWPACSLMESNDLRLNKRAVCVRQKVATMLNINLLCCERESHIVKWTTVFCVCAICYWNAEA